MKIKDLVDERVARLQSVPDALSSAAEKQQLAIWKEIKGLLGEFRLDSEGKIERANSVNYGLIKKITERLKKVLINGSYLNAVDSFTEEYLIQSGLIIDYYQKEFDFTQSAVHKKNIQSAQDVAESLLGEDAVISQLVTPLRNNLRQLVSGGADYSKLYDNIHEYIIGNEEKEGSLLSNTRRVARDTFSTFDRSYSHIINSSLDVQFYQYFGGELKTSREFCIKRHEKFFHRDEIKSWASEDWEGKNKDTTEETIFNFLGGYGCIHSLIAIHVSRVPNADILRAIGLGYYSE